MHANTIKYIVKQYMKMLMQGFFLPVIYQLYRHIPVQSHRVVFADAHHENLPFSMQAMHQTIADMGFEVIDYFYDYRKMNKVQQKVCVRRLRFTKGTTASADAEKGIGLESQAIRSLYLGSRVREQMLQKAIACKA